ncbi:ROK family protein [Corynebacterium sp. A21]|uniref:ROK family protein n=1 Tax=Corynebacterium sp. A21 TaxID=3457318 RepID=UPI003FD4EDFD
MSFFPTAHTVGLDIGGTNLRAGVVTESGKIIDSRSMPTPQTVDDLEVGIAELVTQLRHDHEIQAVGLSVAGFLDPQCEIVRFAPHLPWRDAPVRRIITGLLDLPVRLEHDANSAAWGEYRFGAAREADNWVLLAIGTGIGATLMVGGEIYRGAYGTAPEFGHLPVVPGGRPCPCGKRGCLERYCSGTALVESALEELRGGSHAVSDFTRQLSEHPASVSGQEVFAAAQRGEPVAAAAVESFIHWLGEALAIVADVLDPELILIGGGVSRDSEHFLDAAVSRFAGRIVGAGHRPLSRVASAELGGDAGMIGVADLARHVVPR